MSEAPFNKGFVTCLPIVFWEPCLQGADYRVFPPDYLQTERKAEKIFYLNSGLLPIRFLRCFKKLICDLPGLD